MIEANLVTAPLSMMEAISVSFRLWWKHLGSVIIFSLVSGLISILPQFLGEGMTSPASAGPMSILMLVLISLINIVISTVIYAKFVHAVHGQTINTSQAMALGLTRFWTVLIFSLLYFCIFVGPILLWLGLIHQISGTFTAFLNILLFAAFLIFAMTFFIYTILALPVIVLENLKAIEAFKRSIFLVSGGWWYTSIVISVPFMIAILIGSVFSLLLGKFGVVLGQALFMPLNVAFITVLYEHHKKRLSDSVSEVNTIDIHKE